MKKARLTYFLGFFLIATLALALYYQSKAAQLQKELSAVKAHESEMETSMNVQKELLSVDSLLVDGNYRAALKAYETQFRELKAQENPEIQLRVALAENLLKIRRERHADDFNTDQLQASDSTRIANQSREQQMNRLDSLNFVLEKTKVQLARMKRQLQKKSYGEYLAFTSSKGSQVHYVGEVKNDKANGHGLALLSTGSRYEGEWKDNLRHGEGTFHWKDGEYYVGHYVNDKREGQGTYYWPNGEKYVGQWKNDQRYGEGVFYSKEGKVVDGLWQEDELVAIADKKP